MTKWKRRAAQGAAAFAVLGLLCVAALLVLSVRTSIQVNYLGFDEPAFGPVLQRLEQEGPSPALGEQLAALPKKLGVVAFVITEANGPSPNDGPVLVGDRPEMAGRPSDEVARAMTGNANRAMTTNREVTGPGGKMYWLTGILSAEPPSYVQEAGWIGAVGIAAFAIAWLTMLFWVLSDAQERGAGTAPAWGLLTLLTGPIGLGVYLVVRPAPETCPGCGKQTDRDSLFCPYCRHALRPSCPHCRRPAKPDWLYCAACGSDLADDS